MRSRSSPDCDQLRITSAAALTLASAEAPERHTWRRVEQLLQEGEFAALCRRLPRLEGKDMTVFQTVMPDVRNLALLVEMNREDRAVFDARIKERDPLFDAGNIIPGIAAEGGLRGGIAQPVLYRRFRIGSYADGGFADRIGQISTLADDRCAAEKQRSGRDKDGDFHKQILGLDDVAVEFASLPRAAMQDQEP